jgi:hypothetical protein
MNDDPAMKRMLSQARRGWSPSPHDVERVRRGVEAALASGVPPAPPGPSRAPAWVGRVLLSAAFTAAGAGAGYWVGRHADRPPVSAAAVPGASPSLPSPAAPSPGPAVEPRADVPAPAQPPRRAEQRARHLSLATPAGTAAESLGIEARALRNVERALRDRNPGLASAFLDDRDRSVPGGQMREERSALRAIARCTAGQQPFGVNLADEFGAAYPSSPYQARVQQACRTDSDRTGD